MKSSKLRNVTAILSRIVQIVTIIVDVFLAIMLVLILIMRNTIGPAMQNGDIEVTITGLENLPNGDYVTPLVILIFSAIIIVALVSFMFRNVYLIFKNTNTESPFALSNVKRIRQIGYMALAIPTVEFLANAILSTFSQELNFTVGVEEFLYGMIILCLAQYFAYGASLEKDVNGLV